MRFYTVDFVKKEFINENFHNSYHLKNSIYVGKTKKHVIEFLEENGYKVVKIQFVDFIKKDNVTEIIRF
jgi:hypothetical protein